MDCSHHPFPSARPPAKPLERQVKTAPVVDANKPPVEKSVLLEAINFTSRAIESRLRHYRYLVMATSLTGLGSIILAVVLHRWIFLTGELALPLYFVVFLYSDHRTVMNWRRGIREMRDKQDLKIAQLAKILANLPHIPKATLNSMLAMVEISGPKNEPPLPSAKQQPPPASTIHARPNRKTDQIPRC